MDVECYPDGTLIDRCLEKEIADVLACANFVITKNNLSASKISKRSGEKLVRYKNYDREKA